jgi:hypothetical protein
MHLAIREGAAGDPRRASTASIDASILLPDAEQLLCCGTHDAVLARSGGPLQAAMPTLWPTPIRFDQTHDTLAGLLTREPVVPGQRQSAGLRTRDLSGGGFQGVGGSSPSWRTNPQVRGLSPSPGSHPTRFLLPRSARPLRPAVGTEQLPGPRQRRRLVGHSRRLDVPRHGPRGFEGDELFLPDSFRPHLAPRSTQAEARENRCQVEPRRHPRWRFPLEVRYL